MRLVAERVTVRRGEDALIRDLSFTVSSGVALVLNGPNGAGKSTLLRTIAGFLRPERGVIRLEGEDVPEHGRPAELGHYLGHRNAMKQELSVAENLAFWTRYLGDRGAQTGLSLDEAAEAVGLAAITHLPYAYLSAGQQRRFAMAKLLTASRPIWILDEPTAALDQAADRLFGDLMARHLAEGGMILAATHQPLILPGATELRLSGFDHRAYDNADLPAPEAF